jgi:hypothetical protein
MRVFIRFQNRIRSIYQKHNYALPILALPSYRFINFFIFVINKSFKISTGISLLLLIFSSRVNFFLQKKGFFRVDYANVRFFLPLANTKLLPVSEYPHCHILLLHRINFTHLTGYKLI